jgi:hypothetical protein
MITLDIIFLIYNTENSLRSCAYIELRAHAKERPYHVSGNNPLILGSVGEWHYQTLKDKDVSEVRVENLRRM